MIWTPWATALKISTVPIAAATASTSRNTPINVIHLAPFVDVFAGRAYTG
ncbi:MAG: hypothetical protein FWH11_11280 [Micrococcales bacterium]|nr:hypothetical protein [Micrococcales bacterium]